MARLLQKINKPNDIKKIPERFYPELAQEIRDFLIEKVSETGGHFASNMGVVEITMALHLCLDLPKDKVIFDVGHQSYVHKLLTGRKDEFDTLRQYGGLCGFPKRKESDCDCFGTGHSSTSLAAAAGFVSARKIKGTDETIVAVIGDGALSGGLAYEALNNISTFKEEKENLIIILNDNTMSISQNVGGMSTYLSDLRSRRSYTEFKSNVENVLNTIPGVGKGVAKTLKKSKDSIKSLFVQGMLFEDMGITYYGPVDGHDTKALIHAINRAKQLKGPIMIHAITVKGKGYQPAENNPEKFHGIGAFDIRTGNLKKPKKAESYTDVFSRKLISLAEQNKDITAITAAMPSGTGLSAFAKKYPNRFFDVGIAEQYAVTFAAGQAAEGLRPVFAVYSSFLQRAYDQVVHDVCIQKLPVFFGVDRSGLVGADGETHQGTFDISYLGSIPNLVVIAPKNGPEMEAMMEFGIGYHGPVAMKYARSEAYQGLKEYNAPIELGKAENIYTGTNVVIVAVGNIMVECEKAVQILREQGYDPGLVNARFISPLDTEMIDELAKSYQHIITVEENVLTGGFGSKVSEYLHNKGYETGCTCLGIHDCFVEHGSIAQQRKDAGIDAVSVADTAMDLIHKRES